MGWILLSLLVSVITVLNIHYHRREPLKDWRKSEHYVFGAVGSFIIALFLIGLFGGMYSATEDGNYSSDRTDCEEYVNSWNIVSVMRGKETSSSFILGTGGSHTVDRFYVYRQEAEGLLFTTYNAHKTYVVEQDEQPKYKRIDYVCPQPVYDFLWFSSGNTKHNYGKYGTLYVPKNTILREYKL